MSIAFKKNSSLKRYTILQIGLYLGRLFSIPLFIPHVYGLVIIRCTKSLPHSQAFPSQNSMYDTDRYDSNQIWLLSSKCQI